MMQHFAQKALNLAVRRDRPAGLVHFLTHRCNARCPHCFGSAPGGGPSLSLADIDRFTRTAGPGLLNVNLTGGEPFLAPEIGEITRLYLRNTGAASVFISTNGSLPDKILAYARALAGEFPGRQFIFSLSADQIGAKHDAHRGLPGLFDRVLESYAGLKALGGNVAANINITVSAFNAADLPEIFRALTSDMGVDAVTATLARSQGRYRPAPADMERALSGYDALTGLIESGLKSGLLRGMGGGLLGQAMNYKEKKMYAYIREEARRPGPRLPCRAGAGLLGVIYPDGDVYPCELLGEKLGSLHEHGMDLGRLWAAAAPLRRQVAASACHCTYECAWSYNILASPLHWPGFAGACLRSLAG